MEQALGEQQFSTVSIIASDINQELEERIKSLEMIAAKITPAMLGNASSMQTFLESHVSFPNLFNYGGIVLRLDGVAIAEVPNHGRIGINYSGRDYMIPVLKGKTTISKTVMGKTSRSPFFSMLTPIRDTKGKVIGVLAGATDLSNPNFLTKITDNKYGKTGGYLLVSPEIRTIVYATNKKRIMEVLPAPGVNPLIDRYIQGYEGSGVTIRPGDGAETLSSAKGIPVSGWYVVATMPTEEAFAPIRAMQQRMLLAAIFLTLLAGGLTWWILKRQLAPVFTTIKTLAILSDTDQHPQPLPITRQDEIGELIGGFNHLLATLGKREEALRESEERFNLSMEATKDGLWDWNIRSDETYFSPGYYRMLGYEADAFPGKGNAWKDLVHPDDREHALRANMDCIEGRRDLFEVEYRMKDMNGEWRWIFGRGKCVARDEQGRALRLVGTHVDITERKLAEEALRKSEERYRTILQTTMYGFWLADMQGHLLEVNESYCRMSGYSKEELLTMSASDLEAAETDAETAAHMQRVMTLGDDRFETWHHRKNGSVYEVEISVQYKPSKEGQLVAFLRDITDRKQAEEALADSELFNRGLVENMPDYIIVYGTDGKILYVNPATEMVLGYNAKDLVGTSVLSHIAEERRDEVISNMKVRQEGREVPAYETDIVTKDGHRRSVLVKGTPIRYHDNPAFLVLLVDITESKRVEAALRESEELFRVSMERAPDGVYMNDLEGNFLYGNRKAEEIIGYKREELIGRNFLDFNIIAEGSLGKAAELLKANTEGRSSGPDEIEMIRKDGRHILIEINNNVIQRGGQINVLAFVRDITERKRAEEEKRDLHERLNRSEKMEALGLLAGGVAHDLNNVLGIVVGYAELVLMNADKSSSIRPQLVNIMSGGLKAAAIVDDLLTLARRGVSGREVLNLNKIIADCHHSPEFANLSSHHPYVKIKTELDPGLLNISGSSVHLGKSLYNLISNASDAMPNGGIVTIKTTNQYLDKPIQGYDQIQEGDYVVLSVSDTGEGISADNLKRIFEPFYTKKVMGRSGTGLGLAVVWGTVKDHHGYINVQSEEGNGSTFTLYFPVTREGITAEAVAVDISAYMGSGESILVVDDVKEQRDLAAGMLRTLDYNVSSVSSGEEVLAYLKDHQAADLIVLDMIMDPGMDGLDTYMSILKIRPKQKAIIVSGFSESDRVRAARDLGAGAYVRKPYIKEKLGLAVRKELDRVA
jgi:PAS domain S-box-containing protein